MNAWSSIVLTMHFYISIHSQEMITCSSVGVWSSWSSWHNTAPVDQYGLYFQSRQSAVYAEVRLCVQDETYPAHCSDNFPVSSELSTMMDSSMGSTAGTVDTTVITRTTTPAITTKIGTITPTLTAATVFTGTTIPTIETTVATVSSTVATTSTIGTTATTIPTIIPTIMSLSGTTTAATFATGTTAAATPTIPATKPPAPTTAAAIPTIPATKPPAPITAADIDTIPESTTAAAVPTTSVPVRTSPTTSIMKPAAPTTASVLPTTKSTIVTLCPEVPSTVPSLNFQLRHEDVIQKLLEKHHQIIPSIKKIRTKRQLNFCRACVNLVATTSNLKHNNGADGQLVIVYGVDSGGCRTADIICYSGSSTNQDAIIYANGNKNSPLAISPTGTIQLNLFCDRNSHWTIPNLQINIRSVTCLLQDNLQPTVTRPPPTLTTPKPCSTCPNVITAKVENPALGEIDGMLTIQYEKDDNGCRVAKLVCSTNYEFTEAIIYLNGMKNSPVARSKNGTVMFSLLCSNNLRFRLFDSRDFISNVTCLSREFTPPTTTTMRAVTTKGPPLCSKCGNIRTLKISNLKVNERNGQLKIEYSKQADGCRLANIVCGDGEIQTTARIFVNGRNDLPLISDITGEVEIELACGTDTKWKVFQATAIIESVSCLIIDVSRTTTMEPATTSAGLTVPECQAQWTEWISWSSCTDSCGAFGSRKRFRSCERNHDDCFCIGSISDSEFCNIQPCLYPRSSCRKDYFVSAVDQKFACVPKNHIGESA
uniref:C6 domain-containing protein n=1 Tax=Setaria digitata TaxID=48799 RepID=A0A915Q047_9BILA